VLPGEPAFATVVGAMRKHRRQLDACMGAPGPHDLAVRERLHLSLNERFVAPPVEGSMKTGLALLVLRGLVAHENRPATNLTHNAIASIASPAHVS
jgi:hypothetical protein